MKKTLCIIFTFTVVLSLIGCRRNSEEIKTPVEFYYKNATVTYNQEDAVIISEIRDRAELGDALADLLDLYLQGPITEDCISPFPAGVSVVSVEYTDNKVCITLSDSFGTLDGMEQTIACACLSKTVMELVPYDNVEIAVNANNGNETLSIIMDAQSLFLLDNNYPDAE